jgi:hypothetical protein
MEWLPYFRRMKNSIAVLLFVAFIPFVSFAKKEKAKAYYEATVYHFTSASQQKVISGFLEKSLIPALHKNGLRAGVFSPLANDTAADKTIYVIVDYKNWKQIIDLRKVLRADALAFDSSKDFNNAPFNAPAYTRKEVILMEAFPMSPMMKMPMLKTPKADHIYEWRSYESATEDLFTNKVKMFNEGGDEIGIFTKLNFNAIFYSSVIAGCRMPNLIYMTSFENLEDRNAHWKAFGSDPDWKRISGMAEYQNNVSKSDIFLMKALPFSDY